MVGAAEHCGLAPSSPGAMQALPGDSCPQVAAERQRLQAEQTDVNNQVGRGDRRAISYVYRLA